MTSKSLLSEVSSLGGVVGIIRKEKEEREEAVGVEKN